ncbi:conserved hypothetical protein [Trichormus variabilis ATCC 29413]|uniref:Uncharacterized protein n=2 Tax=Anabaena variabilis TaxID=264691 RepID=Q3M379_TRIV2|nr:MULTISPECIES: hypothetical protein [Nostocaceae]ABA24557.1 conserved hypothetical protein [Trichormus variabilis ATCC 29413]MBC1212849.1 hypothetical protein [Trichormus variabilis ARAD]MBC1256541.1 hypothetical protein [Trichormus variabilis V5]MBC1266056.1 hypothetical protein [Trichormus variabilis FSR]MBC1301295.1 hypothetical protein [Trichormus variabilis N2B]
MIVIVASRHDKAAEALALRWMAYDAKLLTVEDFSVAGWRHYLDSPLDSTAVIGGQAIAVAKITGVLTRLPYLPEQELLHIAPEDRAYVAAEMNAFLVSWLSGLPCPVLNRPTPTYLLGPNWRPQQWAYAAAQIGIPVRPVRRQVTLSAPIQAQVLEKPPVTVTVVGHRCLGQVDDNLANHAKRLACAAKVDLLTVQFSSSEANAEFLNAELWADISHPEICDAILEHLSGGDGKC